jgi:hypothetical protein
MMLSYWFRLACIALFSVGVIQFVLEFVLWLASPAMARSLERSRPRTQERVFLFAQLTTHGLAFLLAFLVLVPEYVRDESNVLEERVGWIFLLVTGVVLYRYANGAFRAAGIWLRTWRWQKQFEAPLEGVSSAVPVVCVPDEPPVLAVAGLFSPSIVISRSLLAETALEPAALEVALAHENAHAKNRDNLKLLLLSCLPHFEPGTSRRPSLLRRWQSFSEFAADDEAVKGSRARSVLLAEALVAVARSASRLSPRILAMTLLAHEQDLESRVSRLLGPMPSVVVHDHSTGRLVKMGGAAFLVAGAAVLFGLVVSSWQVLAEYLLHLG